MAMGFIPVKRERERPGRLQLIKRDTARWEAVMTDFFQKMIEPILIIQSEHLRRLAWELENKPRDNDDNISRNTRMQTAEVLKRVARVQDFADWLLPDDLGEELDRELGDEP